MASSLVALVLSAGVAREARAGILFRDDFEGGTGAWTFSGGWGTTTTGPHSVTRSLTDTPGYNYSANSNTTATKTTPLDLTNARAPRFRFWTRYSSESLHDWLNVEISINGTNFITQNQLGGSQATWREVEIPLTGLAGRPAVWIRFRTESDAIIHGDGWYIDDLVFDDGNPAVTFTSPLASTVWAGNSNETITWTYDGSFAPLATSMTVYGYVENVGFQTLQTGLPMGTTSQAWLTPADNNPAAQVRIDILDAYGSVLNQVTSRSFTIDSAAPSTFAPVSPTDGACGSSTPAFDWGNASDVSTVSYTLDVNPSSGTPLAKTGLATSDYTLTQGEALQEAGNPHDWTVTAEDAAGHSRTSVTRSYQVDTTPPPAFAVTAPSDGTMTDGVGLVFSWEAATDTGCGLSHYVLSIDGNVCADDLPSGTTSLALDATSCAALAAGTHTWTVAAVDTAGNVGFSAASPGGLGGWEFTLPDETIGGDAGAGGEPGTAGTAGTSVSGSGGSASATGGTGGGEPEVGGESSGGSAAGEGPGTGGNASSGSGGAGGTGGTGGSSPSTGGSSGAMPHAGAAGQRAQAAPSAKNDGGCGCRVAKSPSNRGWSAALAVLGLIALRRRRKTR
jgi:MYXO-CTERM domain-containing protein